MRKNNQNILETMILDHGYVFTIDGVEVRMTNNEISLHAQKMSTHEAEKIRRLLLGAWSFINQIPLSLDSQQWSYQVFKNSNKYEVSYQKSVQQDQISHSISSRCLLRRRQVQFDELSFLNCYKLFIKAYSNSSLSSILETYCKEVFNTPEPSLGIYKIIEYAIRDYGNSDIKQLSKNINISIRKLESTKANANLSRHIEKYQLRKIMTKEELKFMTDQIINACISTHTYNLPIGIKMLPNPMATIVGDFEALEEIHKYVLCSLMMSGDHLSLYEDVHTELQTLLYSLGIKRLNKNQLRKLLQPLKKTFIDIEKLDNETSFVHFKSASVIEYLFNYLWNNQRMIEFIFNNSRYLNQLFYIFSYKSKYTPQIKIVRHFQAILEKKIMNDLDNLYTCDSFQFEDGSWGTDESEYTYRLLIIARFFNLKANTKIRKFLIERIQQNVLVNTYHNDEENYTPLLEVVSPYLSSNSAVNFRKDIKKLSTIDNIERFMKLAKIYPMDYEKFALSKKKSINQKVDRIIRKEIKEIKKQQKERYISSGYINEKMNKICDIGDYFSLDYSDLVDYEMDEMWANSFYEEIENKRFR